MEQKERECIANAFESYSNWQGSQNAEEVKQLAGGNPSDFAKDPKWPTYSERRMKGPIKVEPIKEDLKHETGLRPSSLQRCASPPDNPQAVDEQVTAVQGSLDHTADSDIARDEAADTANKAREHLALNHVELLHAWAESADEGQKSYNSSKFQKKEKSRGKLQRQEKEPVSKFPRAKKNATLHPNLTEEKHYNARTKELIAEGRLTAYNSPYEQKVCKIVRIENHHENERERIFLYSLTGDSANPHYLSLSKATLSENQQSNKTKQKKKKQKNKMNRDAHNSRTGNIRKTHCEDFLGVRCSHAAITIVNKNFHRLLCIFIKQE
jgi:hypothetical protein